MSGGGGQLKAERSKRGKASKRKKMKRVGFYLDMTPLVDITFLLLTFFMFTTTMAAPQVMEMSIPPEVDVQIDVPESLILQFFVREDSKIFYALGKEDPQEVSIKDIKNLAIRENLKEDKKNKLIVAVKPAEGAYYNVVVNILDELNLSEIVVTSEIGKTLDKDGKPTKRERKFALVPILEDEAKKLEGL
ncbi:MAG: biopolymer transporter ExbD [Candidatus Gastranaerophilaceae bacterium]|jgi:biopolymer transport protein ExbD